MGYVSLGQSPPPGQRPATNRGRRGFDRRVVSRLIVFVRRRFNRSGMGCDETEQQGRPNA